MSTPPDRFREWLKTTRGHSDPEAERVTRMFRTQDIEELPAGLRNVGWIEDGRLVSFHLTDDPTVTEKAVEKGVRAADVPADDWRWSRELGPGFYISAVPHFWAGRSRRKWEFLDQLDTMQLAALTAALEQRVNSQQADRYISASEHEYVVRQIGYVRSGQLNPDVLLILAGQPYNIAFWKEAFLQPLGIEAGRAPVVLRVEAEGWFAQLSGLPWEEVLHGLVQSGFDGAMVQAGLVSNPEGVIWNPQAIRSLRVDSGVTGEVVGGPRHPKTKRARIRRYERIEETLRPVAQQVPFRELPELTGEARQIADRLATKLARDAWYAHMHHADLESTRGRAADALYPQVIAREYEQAAIRWTRRIHTTPAVEMRMGWAMLHAYRARLARLLPETLLNHLLTYLDPLIAHGIVYEPHYPITPLEESLARLTVTDQFTLAAFQARQLPDPVRFQGNQIVFHRASHIEEPERWWTVVLGNTLDEWEAVLSRWSAGIGGAIEREGRSGRARRQFHWRPLRAAVEELMVLEPDRMEGAIHDFSRAFMRWVVRLLPVDRLESLQLDLGPVPIPF